MTYSPFFPKAEELPSTIPIFPLENAVVLPRSELPLNIFEPRYLNMVKDVLASHRLIGMVQPDGGSESQEGVSVYRTGCAGRLTSFSEIQDGRILISLTGVCRFDIQSELPVLNGYRRAVPNWNRYLEDLATPVDEKTAARAEVLALLKKFFDHKKLDTDWEVLERLSLLELVHTMTTLMPFAPAEKQIILESVAFADRVSALCTVLQFGLEGEGAPVRH